MMKMSYSGVVLCMVVATAMLLSEEATMTEAITCSPAELSPCLGPIVSASPPSATCCQKLKEQESCLCEYIKDPTLKKYVSGPNAQKLASACGVPYPPHC